MSFEDAFQVLLHHEGGYVNDPFDHGHATNYGITIDTLSRYRGHQCTNNDVGNLTLDEAKLIYKMFYWEPLKCDLIKNPKIQVVLFDQGVLSGVATITEKLQQALGIKVDGMFGKDTLNAINSCLDQSNMLTRIVCLMQLRFITICVQEPTQIRFLEGWIRRTQDLLLL